MIIMISLHSRKHCLLKFICRGFINPLTPGTFCKKTLVRFLDILVIFRLDLGQVTFNLVENVFATQQFAFLATSIAF